MKPVRNKKLALALALLLSVLCTACQTKAPAAGSSAAPGEAFPVTVTDLLGRAVTIDEKPQRIASLTPSNTEIVCALSANEQLVGVDDYSDYPESVAALPKVGDYSGPNVEAILAQNADVVLSSTKLQADVIAKLEEVGLTVVATEATTYAEIARSIELIAAVVGADAKPICDAMKASEDAVGKAVAGAEKPSVYFAVSFGEMGNWTCGAGSFIDDMIDIAGGKNVAKDGGAAWMEWSLEKLLADDPDVILVSGDQAMADAFAADATYAALSAVQNGKIYPIDANTSSRPSPRIASALEAIAKALHPDLL